MTNVVITGSNTLMHESMQAIVKRVFRDIVGVAGDKLSFEFVAAKPDDGRSDVQVQIAKNEIPWGEHNPDSTWPFLRRSMTSRLKKHGRISVCRMRAEA